MLAHIRNVRLLSFIFGGALTAWAVWGLATQNHSSSVVVSWLIVLAFASVLVTLAATFGRTRLVGRALLGITSLVFVLYALAWLLLGGVEDAGGYWPALVLGVVFFGYANYVSYRSHTSAG